LEINIEVTQLQKKRLFVATPMYGGQCHGMFTRSVSDLSAFCAAHGIQLQQYFLFNESLITRARNYCVDEFLRSNATHLMFIDSDIGFNAQDVIALMALMNEEDDNCPYDIIGGPYPKKCISWEKIKAAVDKGMSDEDPNVLEKYVGDYVFNPKQGGNEISLSEPAEVLEIGTGFMMISRKILEKYKEAHPELMYKPDHVRTEHFDGSREIMAFFDCVIDPETKRYLSEDYMFCQYVNKIGGRIWLCPWMQLQHAGSYVFGGSLADIASIGASATADASKIGGKPKKFAKT